jgi:DNA ligase (NAD+)
MARKTAQDQVEDLRDEIRRHEHLYFVESRPEISDRQFDHLIHRLKELEKENPELVSPDSPTQRVGERPLDEFASVRHSIPMLSIDNTYNADELSKFDERVAKGLEGADYRYVVDPKIDGVAVSLRYESGMLVLASTRGDGTSGDDVTQNIRTFRTVPLRLRRVDWPEVLEIRGEAYWPTASFAEFNLRRSEAGEPTFANPRNATSGTLKMLDSTIVAERDLRFVAHGAGLIEPATIEGQTEFLDSLSRWGVPISPYSEVCQDVDAVLEIIEKWRDRRVDLEYQIDGLVLKVDRFALRDRLGATSRFPRWCIAYKFESEQAKSKVVRIDVNVGKQGTLTPKAALEPVLLAGTTVSNATLHNFEQIRRLDLRVGDTVVVEKAGEIIPRVIRVLPEMRPPAAEEVKPPTKCPVCDGEVEQDEGGVYLRCINEACAGRLKERLLFFCGRDQMDIDYVGPALVDQLVNAGFVKEYADLFTLRNRREELLKLERMGEKKADNLLDALDAAKSRGLQRLLTALSVRHVGARAAEILAGHFATIHDVAEAPVDMFEDIDEIGPTIAQSIFDYFRSDYGRAVIDSLARTGVDLASSTRRPLPEDLPLTGKSIVVTGTLERFSRKQMQDLIKSQGGKPTSSVSKKTDYVVAGHDPGSKLDKARRLEIAVLTEDEFEELIGTDGG